MTKCHGRQVLLLQAAPSAGDGEVYCCDNLSRLVSRIGAKICRVP
jgi:hypothetical protein